MNRILTFFGVSFIVAVFIAIVFGHVGLRGGCPPGIDGDFEPEDLDAAVEHIKLELDHTYNNSGQQVGVDVDAVKRCDTFSMQFFAILFMMFNAIMPIVISFPREMHVLVKERNNSWYDFPAYYIGKVCRRCSQLSLTMSHRLRLRRHFKSCYRRYSVS